MCGPLGGLELGGRGLGGECGQLVHISPINNAPDISTGSYTPPSSCGTSAPDDACFFGQYYTFEDSTAVLSIAGVGLNDVDLYELCDYTAPECETIDTTVRAVLGSVALNTRSNLVFYVSERNQQARRGARAHAQKRPRMCARALKSLGRARTRFAGRGAQGIARGRDFARPDRHALGRGALPGSERLRRRPWPREMLPVWLVLVTRTQRGAGVTSPRKWSALPPIRGAAHLPCVSRQNRRASQPASQIFGAAGRASAIYGLKRKMRNAL